VGRNVDWVEQHLKRSVTTLSEEIRTLSAEIARLQRQVDERAVKLRF